jgi:hypothetical protein
MDSGFVLRPPGMTAREKVTHADHLLALRLPVKLV